MPPHRHAFTQDTSGMWLMSGLERGALEVENCAANEVKPIELKIGIDEIRQMRANVNIRPSRSRFKIYIIDEVHMLSTSAFNALLKTLEEPPAHVKFIFATTEPTRIAFPMGVMSPSHRPKVPRPAAWAAWVSRA